MIRQKPKVEDLTGVLHHSGGQNPVYEAQQLEKSFPSLYPHLSQVNVYLGLFLHQPSSGMGGTSVSNCFNCVPKRGGACIGLQEIVKQATFSIVKPEIGSISSFVVSSHVFS